MLFSPLLPKCESFLLDFRGSVVHASSVSDPEVSAPWLAIVPLSGCIHALLALSFQVSEVLSEEKSRLSISGWFHGPSLTRPPNYFEPLIPRSSHIPQDVRINACCRDSYLRSFTLWFVFLLMKLDFEFPLSLFLGKLLIVSFSQAEFSSTFMYNKEKIIK